MHPLLPLLPNPCPCAQTLCCRYAFHLPSLRSLLVGFPLRPHVQLGGDVLHITWDIADLTRLPGARCVPLLTGRPVDVLTCAAVSD